MGYEWAAEKEKYEGRHIAIWEEMIPLAQMRDMVASYDTILFDYGGMSMLGCDANIDWWNRWFIETIEMFPSKRWFCISAIQTFDDEDKQRLKDLGVRFFWDER